MFFANWALTFNIKQAGGTTNLVNIASAVVSVQHDSADQYLLTMASGASQGIALVRGDTLLVIADHPLEVSVNGGIAFKAQYLMIDGSDTDLTSVRLTNTGAVNTSVQVVTMGT